jgi:rhomboid protease GluP
MTNIPPAWGSSQPGEPPAEPAPGSRMIRVRRPTGRPIVTYVILGITIFTYLLQELTRAGIFLEPFLPLGEQVLGTTLFQQVVAQGLINNILVLLGGKISPLIQAGQFWRLITPVLLHAGLAHIGFNMYALFSLGPVLESYYGHWRFLMLYLLAGLGGNILSFLMSPGYTPSVGASTSLFGLITAWGIFIYQNRSILGPQARAMLNNVIVIVLINLMLGLSGSIDNWGHLGGLITGLAFSWFAGPRLEVAYNYPEYELVDQRSQMTTWMVGIVLFVLLAGIVFLRISTS